MPDPDDELRISREEHLAWCKRRALEYIDDGDLANAVASMASDLTKHPDTAAADNPFLMMVGLQAVMAGDVIGVRRWIEGFR